MTTPPFTSATPAETPWSPAGHVGAAYRFETFRTGLLLDDMWFSATDPGPGDLFPAFDLPTVDGGRFQSTDLGDRPVVIVFGSRTCPMTESAMPQFTLLHREFGDRARFVLVNTREAHPGELIRQPHTASEKLARAAQLRDHHGVAFEVAVDDIDGSLHRAVSPKPNSAYVVDPSGTILHRAHWANDVAAVRRALTEVVAGTTPGRGTSRAMLAPMMRGVGHLPDIVAAAGPKVMRDIVRAAPPMAGLARLTTWVRPVPKDRRGAAVILGIIAAIAVAIVLVVVG